MPVQNIFRHFPGTRGRSFAWLLPLFALLPARAPAETRVEGAVSGTTTWTKAGSPYIVTGDIIVPEDATLRIGPGVTVRFKSNIAGGKGFNNFDLEILVRGHLVVEGAPGDTVVFTSDDPDPRWDDWQGIVVLDAGKAEIKAAIIEYANDGVRVKDGHLLATGTSVRKCMQNGFNLLHCQAELQGVMITHVGNSGGTGTGITAQREARVIIRDSFIVGVQNGVSYSQRSSGGLENSVVSLCVARGVVVQNATPDIVGCTITGNKTGLILSGGALSKVKQNNIFSNALDLELRQYLQGPVKVDVSGNWWGETQLGLIDERVLDALDDPQRGALAVLEPVLTQAAGAEKSRGVQKSAGP